MPPPTTATAFVVDSFEPVRRLLWVKPDSTWALSLTDDDLGGTGLVTRLRARYDSSASTLVGAGFAGVRRLRDGALHAARTSPRRRARRCLRVRILDE
jgi:hypothetical protein